MFRFAFEEGPLEGQEFWSTPGGGLEGDETYQDAARRELLEETGIINDVGNEVGQRTAIFQMPNGEFVEADERYFCVVTNSNEIDRTLNTAMELKVMKEHHWWSKSELANTKKTVFPENILELINNNPNNMDQAYD